MVFLLCRKTIISMYDIFGVAEKSLNTGEDCHE